MRYEVEQSPEHPEEYVAVAVNEDSKRERYVALFTGPDAQKRAQEYAEWKNSQLEVTGEQLLKR